MKVTRIASILFLSIVIFVGCASEGSGNGELTPTLTLTPEPLSTIVMSCEEARDTIQAALIDYHNRYGGWPTADSQPGDIEWGKLVPEFMDGIPSNDGRCDWWVNSDPEGGVCLQNIC